MNGETLKTHSIETFAWDAAGDLLIKTYYDMPADIGNGDDVRVPPRQGQRHRQRLRSNAMAGDSVNH
jgi:hypothetical protein